MPYFWNATLTRVDGSDLPLLSLTHGAHMRNLASSHASARNDVFTTHPHAPLIRTNSGTLSGFFTNYGMVGGSTTTAMVGGAGVPVLTAYMYQPVSQPFAFRPFATTPPSGKQPALIPPTNQTTKLLKQPLSLSVLEKQLLKVDGKNANNGKNAAAGTLVRRARTSAPVYNKLHGLLSNDAQRATLIRAIVNHPNYVTTLNWPAVIAGLPGIQRRRLQSLLLDPNFQN